MVATMEEKQEKGSSTKPSEKLTIRAQKMLKSFYGFLWNPVNKSILGRDGRSWGLISLYYAAFYTFLFAYFVAIFAIYYSFLSKHLPKYFNVKSVMDYTGVNPGLGFRPQLLTNPGIIEMDGGTKSKEAFDLYKSYVTNYLIQNVTDENKPFIKKDCLNHSSFPLPKGYACEYNWNTLIKNGSECSMDDEKAGYFDGAPCVIIKLNRIIEWFPRIALDSVLFNDTEANFVHFNCTGARQEDAALLNVSKYYSMGTPEGDLKYGKIPFSYFPYYNAYNYVPAFVVVKFGSQPNNSVINVACRAWAGNIDHSQLSDLSKSRGMARFQLSYTVG